MAYDSGVVAALSSGRRYARQPAQTAQVTGIAAKSQEFSSKIAAKLQVWRCHTLYAPAVDSCGIGVIVPDTAAVKIHDLFRQRRRCATA
jgi:hypothetical protein